ncbi:hypothetical protein V8E53_010687 [Lactarius tabidus]
MPRGGFCSRRRKEEQGHWYFMAMRRSGKPKCLPRQVFQSVFDAVGIADGSGTKLEAVSSLSAQRMRVNTFPKKEVGVKWRHHVGTHHAVARALGKDVTWSSSPDPLTGLTPPESRRTEVYLGSLSRKRGGVRKRGAPSSCEPKWSKLFITVNFRRAKALWPQFKPKLVLHIARGTSNTAQKWRHAGTREHRNSVLAQCRRWNRLPAVQRCARAQAGRGRLRFEILRRAKGSTGEVRYLGAERLL